MANAAPETGYAPVDGLDLYYETHGAGAPLVVLHGAYMTIGMMVPVIAALAERRRVIALELQGHGHTADVDRPLTYERMADDVAGLVRHLGLERVDVFGYSLGGGVALQLVIRHPAMVRKLVVVSAAHTYDSMHPELIGMFETITPEMFAGSPMESGYREVAPNPDDFPTLVEKLKRLDMTPFAWPDEEIRGIAAPTLLIVGDADAVQLEHVVAMFRLLGGGVPGDLVGLPTSQLAVLPGTTHFVPPGSGVLDRAEWLLPMMTAFLDAPLPEAE